MSASQSLALVAILLATIMLSAASITVVTQWTPGTGTETLVEANLGMGVLCAATAFATTRHSLLVGVAALVVGFLGHATFGGAFAHKRAVIWLSAPLFFVYLAYARF